MICLNYEVAIIFPYRSIFSKQFSTNYLQKKIVSSQIYILDVLYCVIYVNPKNQLTQVKHSKGTQVQKFSKLMGSVWNWMSKSSHRRCSVKKGVFRNFAKFTGKHLCQSIHGQSLFFNKAAGLRAWKFIKKRESGTYVLLLILRNF